MTILTVVFGLGINRFLQFQRLKIFYLESFSLSKVFIFFGVGREGANTLARFLQGDGNGNDNLNVKILTGTITITLTGTVTITLTGAGILTICYIVGRWGML